ncbi:hypothetical protein T439DRAFT_326895 [Meredithblackwellia eburnea MCA 4105]
MQRSGLSHRDTRSALLGSSNTPTNSGRNSPLPMYYNSQAQANRTAEEIEGQNENQLEGLRDKVKLLKQITVNIGTEITDSTKMLAGMNDSFDTTGGLLQGTVRRMNKMAKRQGGQFCYWVIFLLICVCVFFWTWLLRR